MLGKLYTPKQMEALRIVSKEDFFIMVLHGAKRAGKTVADNDSFLLELQRVRRIADKLGIKEPQYILAGNSLGSLYRNVLMELTNKYDLEFHMDKFNRFDLLGVKVCCFGHGTITDYQRIRGMTSFGAYINEGSTANEMVFKEIISRCSAEGARVLVDTNPDYPTHWLKKDYIDKANGSTIRQIQFRLDDNTFLTERYRNNIKEATPTGMFYDRDIEGMWVSAEGVIYKDFDMKKHVISREEFNKKTIIKRWCGLDWGYEHFGSIVLLAEDTQGNIYLEKEIAHQYKEIDFWVEEAKKIKSQYGNIPFFCDTARPEHVARFSREGIFLGQTDKSVMAGIELVSSYFKQNKLFIVEGAKRVFDELYMYAWNEKTGEPIKLWDDVLDSVRYAIYSTKKNMGDLNKIRSASYNYLNR